MKEYAKKFYKSKAWKKCRESYIKSVGGLCEECYKQGLINPAVEVHHRTPINEHNITDPEITLHRSNLIALCKPHHSAKHNKTTRRYIIDKYGRVTPIPGL